MRRERVQAAGGHHISDERASGGRTQGKSGANVARQQSTATGAKT